MTYRVSQLLIALGLVSGLAGCTTADIEKFNAQMAELNSALAGNNAAAGIKLSRQPSGNHKPTELIEPSDKPTLTALEQSLPTIKKVLAIQSCIQDGGSMRALNPYAVPGRDLSTPYWSVPIQLTRYHDKNICMSVSRLDEWSMPALNSLRFRSVFFADDSGETNTTYFYMRKMEDGQWKLDSFNSY
jgi:hypothetical protein